MLNFLIITFFYILAEIATLKWFYLLIQQGAPLDIVTKIITGKGYQDWLKILYGSPKVWKNNLGKALGDCEMCLSFWMPLICFACYWAFCRIVLDYWVSDGVSSFIAKIFVDAIWYISIHGISALLGWLVLINIKKNGV